MSELPATGEAEIIISQVEALLRRLNQLGFQSVWSIVDYRTETWHAEQHVNEITETGIKVTEEHAVLDLVREILLNTKLGQSFYVSTDDPKKVVPAHDAEQDRQFLLSMIKDIGTWHDWCHKSNMKGKQG